MRNHRCRRRRSGTTLVELAIVSASALLLIYGLIVGGTGVFRYQEMAHLAREGARYASTHGGQYTMDGIPARTGVPAVTSNDQLHAYLLPKAVALDASFALAYLNRGLAHEQLGDTVAAADDYRRALAIDPEAANARKRLERLQSQ